MWLKLEQGLCPRLFLTVCQPRYRSLEVLEIVDYREVPTYHRMKQLEQFRPKRLADSQKTLEFCYHFMPAEMIAALAVSHYKRKTFLFR